MAKIIIASGPVIVENNQVLLNQHGDTNFWKFCGGRVEDYETGLEENARREVKEEMGIDIEIIEHQPYIMHTEKIDATGQKIDIILVHYLAKRIGEIKPGPDIREWNWFDLNDLPKNLGPNILPTLKYFNFI
jgi:ADP-ribose pyrophosphatase YjhB (NUDIX family)